MMLWRDTVTNIKPSIEHLSDNYEDVFEKMTRQEAEISSLKKRVNRIERTENISQITWLKFDMYDLKRRGRRLNIDLHGISKNENEELLKKIDAVAKKLDVLELTKQDGVDVHWLPSKEGKLPGIIVPLWSQNVRDEWFNRRKMLKRPQDKEFFLENLTKQSREL